MLWISGSKKSIFQRRKLVERWSFYNIYETWIAWSIMITDNNKVFVLNILEMKNVVFLSKKLMEMWYLLINKKFLFWSFWEWEIRSFFEPKTWRKDDIYWLMKRFCFELFGDGKYGLFWVKKLIEKWYLLVTEMFLFWTFWWWEIRSFFSKKVDGKMIFTWSFWALHDISGLRKYGFSCSDCFTLQVQVWWNIWSKAVCQQ